MSWETHNLTPAAGVVPDLSVVNKHRWSRHPCVSRKAYLGPTGVTFRVRNGVRWRVDGSPQDRSAPPRKGCHGRSDTSPRRPVAGSQTICLDLGVLEERRTQSRRFWTLNPRFGLGSGLRGRGGSSKDYGRHARLGPVGPRLRSKVPLDPPPRSVRRVRTPSVFVPVDPPRSPTPTAPGPGVAVHAESLG